MTATLTARLLQGLGDAATAPLGLAVSGGGDSMALLHLAQGAGLQVRAVTLDHGLREGSAAEAALVGRVCAGLGVPHDVLRWQGWDGKGNLQDQARRARRRLIGAWARTAGLQSVALGHTKDDVAETAVMRLARGAGVDGLAAMRSRWHDAGLLWCRPLLAILRQELRVYLAGIGAPWTEDPSNEAMRFDRVKARKALVLLAPLGITTSRLAEVAGHMADARTALTAATDAAVLRLALADAGAVVLDLAGLACAPVEVQRRVLVQVMAWIAPTDYGPRGPAVMRLLAAVLAGRPAGLAGVRFLPGQGTVRAFRDARAVRGLVAPQADLWDGQWRVSGPHTGLEIRALGAEGLRWCPEWRATGRPQAELLATPAIWRDTRLVAAPLAGYGPDWRVDRVLGTASLFKSALSH